MSCHEVHQARDGDGEHDVAEDAGEGDPGHVAAAALFGDAVVEEDLGGGPGPGEAHDGAEDAGEDAEDGGPVELDDGVESDGGAGEKAGPEDEREKGEGAGPGSGGDRSDAV